MLEDWGQEILPGLGYWAQWIAEQFGGAIRMDSILYDFDAFKFRIGLVDQSGRQVKFDISRFRLEEAAHLSRQRRFLQQLFLTGVRRHLAYPTN